MQYIPPSWVFWFFELINLVETHVLTIFRFSLLELWSERTKPRRPPIPHPLAVPGAGEAPSDFSKIASWPYHVSNQRSRRLQMPLEWLRVVSAIMLLAGAAANFALPAYFAWLLEQLAARPCSAIKKPKMDAENLMTTISELLSWGYVFLCCTTSDVWVCLEFLSFLEQKMLCVFSVLLRTSSQQSNSKILLYVESGRMPSPSQVSWVLRPVWMWGVNQTGNDWIPSSLRWSSLNTLGHCAAEVSYLFFLSCWARFHTVFTRGSHAFQQWWLRTIDRY